MGAAYRQVGNIGCRTASLQHGCSRPWWLGTRAGVESLRRLGRLQKTNNMQQCGICSVLSDVFRRIMCIGGSRRGSGDSYYQELDAEDVSNSCLIRNQQPRLLRLPEITSFGHNHMIYGDHGISDVYGFCLRLRLDFVVYNFENNIVYSLSLSTKYLYRVKND